MKTIFMVLMIVMAMTKGFSQAQEAGVIRNLSAAEFKKAMDSVKGEVVVDLRTPEELKGGKIAGAIEIDFFGSNFEPALAALDKNKVYFLYCASGGRSGETAGIMNKMGFKTLYNLDGGFRGWMKNKMPVSKR